MVIRSIKNENLFKIDDNNTQNTIYGCDQEWFTTEWQRRAGCGPTVAANIIYYLNCTRNNFRTDKLPLTKSEALSLMEEVYEYVTPTPRGIPTTKLLYNDVQNYAQAMSLDMKIGVMDVPENRELRPQFHDLIAFLDKALSNDIPIAFLNLDNGTEKKLDSWHWVTIISLEYELDGNIANISFLDGGTINKINLGQWFNTTTLGGGFVILDFISK